MKREELQVDVARFVEHARLAGWAWQAQSVLRGVSGKAVPQDIEAWQALPMQTESSVMRCVLHLSHSPHAAVHARAP